MTGALPADERRWIPAFAGMTGALRRSIAATAASADAIPAAGEIPKVPFNLFLLKSANVLGVFWGAWTERDPAGHRDNVAQLLRWAADGKLSSHVHAVYPMDEAAQALKAIAERKVMGKVILRP
jgi:NADPH:quinone reductase-like Zn-dependent oxidoreductase